MQHVIIVVLVHSLLLQVLFFVGSEQRQQRQQQQTLTLDQSREIWELTREKFPNYCIIIRTNYSCGEHDFERNATFYIRGQAVETLVLR